MANSKMLNARENPLTVDTVCGGCIEYLQEQTMAAELERLRAELQSEQERHKSTQGFLDDWLGVVASLRIENMRLRRELARVAAGG